MKYYAIQQYYPSVDEWYDLNRVYFQVKAEAKQFLVEHRNLLPKEKYRMVQITFGFPGKIIEEVT